MNRNELQEMQDAANAEKERRLAEVCDMLGRIYSSLGAPFEVVNEDGGESVVYRLFEEYRDLFDSISAASDAAWAHRRELESPAAKAA